MKKFLTSVLAIGLSLTMLNCAFGATGKIIQGKTMVPVRGVFETLGFDVSWDNQKAVAIIKNSDYEIEIPKKKNYFSVNGKSIKPIVAQTVVNGQLYIPLTAIEDSINADTSWDATNEMAHISYNKKDIYVNCKTPQKPAPKTNTTKKTKTNTTTTTTTPKTNTNYNPDHTYNNFLNGLDDVFAPLKKFR